MATRKNAKTVSPANNSVNAPAPASNPANAAANPVVSPAPASNPANAAANPVVAPAPITVENSSNVWKIIIQWLPKVGQLLIVIGSICALPALLLTNSAITNNTAALNASRKTDWQRATVFQIILDGYLKENKRKRGLTFDEIQRRYKNEAAVESSIAKSIGITKDDLDASALQKTIMELLVNDSIHLVTEPGGDDFYAVSQHVLNPRFDRVYLENDIKYQIIDVLTRDGGKYGYNDLKNYLDKGHNWKVTPEEFNYGLTQLIASGMIKTSRDVNDKSRIVLWSAVNCPNCPLSIGTEAPPLFHDPIPKMPGSALNKQEKDHNSPSSEKTSKLPAQAPPARVRLNFDEDKK